ncbi:hypothetical protein A3C23_04170 [Candidatus Roizmanbacteria bacterium RIFCSPHIGHO2_02_FULL_37_13b]|uniref:Hydroxyacid dehydrogenase n=1 Tax=Candidatus Roizmanbacteria bacterium RIFCSPLOWO2_02_FULL_36_11 TaxID=1802071 RepID=A0A1F7JH09_9BACT|nr:MAG: hypothetical protein A3C23_04170 [Candidatus Roizmanbacteria bacterium RIFCSPHIGHO2_02_FULL_37_13b]OGK54908.1 MAG: hypothetical protein A3H78_00315 [Candidatus Roizmanbacteria bacterium RIFCSPLOWO2_02_FULL_36_11]
MTKFKKILVTGFDKSALDEDTWTRINKLTNSISFKPSKEADCLFSRFNRVDKVLIDSLPNLKYIGLLATGTGTVDLIHAKKKNITVCNIPGYATESVAEWVFGVILEHLHDLERAKYVARNGDFSGSGFSTMEILGKKFGVIGLGRIGKRVAEIAAGFGAKVCYWSRNRKKEMENKGISYEPLDALISTCDFISLHLLYNKDTADILSEKLINSLKKGAIVINVAPMELVNIPALKKRLKQNDITFILDHPDEMNPIDVKQLSRYKNCIIYPPIGYVSKESRVLKQNIFISNLENFLGNKPINKVN